MSLYVISDLHLSTNENTGKSMEVFGPRWQNYISRLERNWRAHSAKLRVVQKLEVE